MDGWKDETDQEEAGVESEIDILTLSARVSQVVVSGAG